MTTATELEVSINSAGTLSQSVYACNWAKAEAIAEEYNVAGMLDRLEFPDGSALTLAYANGFAIATVV